MTITDDDIMGLLHGAFVPEDEDATAGSTLLGSVGRIDSSIDNGILMLGSGDGNDFYAVPLDLDRLRDGIAAIARKSDAPQRPDETDQRLWDAMDDGQKALHVSEDMRPSGISPARWNAWSWRERAAQGMHRQTEEWDSRGAMSDMKPARVEFEDLAIMARIMAKLPQYEVERLVRLGYLAGGPDTKR